MTSAEFHCPSSLQWCVPYHLSSSPGPSKDQCPNGNLFTSELGDIADCCYEKWLMSCHGKLLIGSVKFANFKVFKSIGVRDIALIYVIVTDTF